jgi:hypothetical protein
MLKVKLKTNLRVNQVGTGTLPVIGRSHDQNGQYHRMNIFTSSTYNEHFFTSL